MNINPPIKLIVGLGNYGDEYHNTRHNAGWWFVDQILNKFEVINFWNKEIKFNAQISKVRINKNIVIIIKPLTYMNNSGISVVNIANFHKISPQQILVAHDELDIKDGSAKLKIGGSAGGHNGIKSIDNHLKNKNYWRLRLGIDHPRSSILPTIANQSVADYVLHSPTKEQIKSIDRSIDQCIKHLGLIINGEMEKFMMNIHNQ